ncbi:DUF4340 domain-containing protein [Alteromonas sp. RKMC-009]|uniref:DUF4340 domain-containing protein n=1 Tax=Alteromonas sp. RKMC-009 TaxID=2267264 RepID=UPI0013757BAF|nr:DUF4340 domain-containing protein [Alteromonas sp. RKMC-009]
MNLRVLILSGLVAVSAGVAGWLQSHSDRTTREASAEHELQSELATAAKDIQRIKIETHEGVVFAAVKDTDRWIATHLDTIMTFPVDMKKLAKFANALNSLEVLEPKTSQPEFYHRLGVESVRDNDARSLLIEIGGEKEAFSLLVGRSASGNRGTYVRQPEASTSLLVNKTLPLPEKRSDWLSREIFAFNSSDISAVDVEIEGQPLLTLNREGETADGWQIAGYDEATAALRYPTIVGQTVDKMLRFDFDGVKPFLQHKWSEVSLISQVIFSLEDGSEVMAYLSAPDPRGRFQLWIDTPDSPRWISEWVFELSEYQARAFLPGLENLTSAI